MLGLDHLPDFKGKNFPLDQLDAVLAYGFNKKDLEDSRALYQTKWWDYRFLHLGSSLFLFAHYYQETVDQWRSRFGLSPHVKLDQLWNPLWRRKGRGKVQENALVPVGTRTGYLRSMLYADAYGIPYDKWISWAFEFAFENKWTRLPTPTMLYGDRVTAHILERWKEERQWLMRLPTDPRFLAENYQGHVWQDEFQKWLSDEIIKRTNPTLPLKNFLIDEPFLVESLARNRFGDTAINKALCR